MDLFENLAELRAVMGDVALSDAALTVFEADAEAAILAIAGPLGTSTYRSLGRSSIIMLPRYAASIEAVREGIDPVIALASDDWRLLSDRRSIERLPLGTNPAYISGPHATSYAFLDPVEVDYTPADDLATRRVVAVLLIRAAAVAQPGVLGMTEGNFSIQYANGQTYSVSRDDALEAAGPLWGFG